MERNSSIEEHVTCSICMDLYNDPLALPCLHSFCRRCLQGLFSSSLVIKCPECRKDVKLGPNGVNDLPRNFQIAGIVEIYKNENAAFSESSHGRTRDGPPSCTQHRMTCQLMCTRCKVPVCLRCITDFHSGHKMAMLSPLKEKEESSMEPLKCFDHNRIYKLYCNDCDKLSCLECIVKHHYAHSLTSIEEAYAYSKKALGGTLNDLDVRSRLLRATQKTCRTLAQKSQMDAQNRRQDLSMYFNRIRESLDKREAELRSELDYKEQKICQAYMSHYESATRKEKLVDKATDDFNRLSTENKLQFLQVYPSKACRVSDLLGEETADSPPEMKGINDITLLTCSFEKELSNIEWKWPKEEKLKPTRQAPPVPAARKSVSERKPKSAQRPPTATNTLSVGTQVKRGKAWRDGMMDGGPGHIGTVTQICLDPDTYTVRWPNGRTGNYKYCPPFEEEVCMP